MKNFQRKHRKKILLSRKRNIRSAELDMSEVQKGAGENENLSIGIDVAGYQEGIDWQRAV